jgi:F-type H+-transporting ATPase subunit epsilon
MAKLIQCDIVSAEEKIFSGDAIMVFAAGEQGDLGITPRHAPLITRMRAGEVRVRKPDGEENFYYVSGGILEVQPHKVTVLADTAQRAKDIDEAAAQEAKRRAQAVLMNQSTDMEVADAQAQLAEAVAQLQALERLRKNLKH